MSARVEGVGRAKRRIREAAIAVGIGATEAQRLAAADVAEEWRRDAPVETGAYRDSIRSDQDSAFSDIEYGPFVEFGTSTRPAQPAGRTAAARVERRYAALVAGNIRRKLRRFR